MASKHCFQRGDDDRRDNIERRECEYTYCIPERRTGQDRRKNQR